MNIAVLGGGAMGGLFGAYLSRNNPVTIVDVNSSVVEKIQRDGLEIQEPDGSAEIFHPNAVVSTENMAPVELVLIFLNSRFTETALSANRGIIGPETSLMTLQNGSGHEQILSKFVPEERIIIGTTQHNASGVAPGVSRHGGSGATYLGCVTGSAERLQRFASVFSDCGLETYVSDNVQKMIWNKLLTNVSASALTAVLQMPLGFISSDEHAWRLCAVLIREAVDVAAALGMEFDYEQKLREVREVCDKSPNGLTSIYTDLHRGRKSEVDAISGSVVRAGQKAGVPTPGHAFLVELIHAMEDRGPMLS